MEDIFQSYKPVKIYHTCVSMSKRSSNPPIILIHGFYGTCNTWRRILNKLSSITNRKVYAIDLRNHGKSEYSDEFSTKHLTVDLLNFMKEENINSAVLIGHSAGGRVAMEIALHKPELVEKLIIEDIAISDNDKNKIESFGILTTHIYQLISTLPPTTTEAEAYEKLKPVTDKYLPQFAANQIKSTVETALPFYKDEVTGEFKFTCNMEVMTKLSFDPSAMRNDLTGNPTYNGKTLFIKGEYTIVPIDEDRTLIKKHFPKVKFVTIKRGYHVSHTENANDFVKVVVEFLRS